VVVSCEETGKPIGTSDHRVLHDGSATLRTFNDIRLKKEMRSCIGSKNAQGSSLEWQELN
jgi:hypothetical protein